MPRTLNPAWRFLLPIAGLWLLLYGSYALSRPPLPDGPGTMHAEIAREMVTRNDWTTPFVNGIPVQSSSRTLDRSIAVSFKLFGAADWSARLPLALCVLAMAVAVFFFGRKLFVWNAAGLYSALFVLTVPITFLATRDLTEDPVIAVATTLFALVLWQLLVVKKFTGWNAIGISATACLVALLALDWPAMLTPLVLVALCWIVRRLDEPERQARWFLIAWAACAYLFANIFGVHPRGLTVLGAVSPLAMLLGGWLADNEAFSDQRTLRVARYIFAAGLAISAVALFFAIHGHVGFDVGKHSVRIMTGSFTRVPLLISFAALVAGVGGHLYFRLRNRIRIANCFLAGTLAGLIVAIQVGLVIDSPRSSSQILADAIRPELNPTDLVVIDGKYPDASSLAFYLERPILIAAPANTPFPAVSILRGTVALNQAWTGASRVFLWTSVAHPLAVPGKSFVVALSGAKQILSNEPNSAGASF